MSREIIKDCKHHGKTIFVIEKRGYYRCRKCRMTAVQKRRRNTRKKLVSYKGGSCERCGYDKCVAALDFHHRNPEEKSFGLSERGLTRAWSIMIAEVDKCMLLCANCHRELHHNET